jgi:aspartyl protease family protein
MLRLAGVAVIGAVMAAAAAHTVAALGQNHDTPLRPAEAVAQAPGASADAAPAQGDPASVVKAADGNYWADAVVDGHAVHFLVDTGASAVSLTPDDAQRLGYSPQSLSYSYQVSTANGPTLAAKVKLESVTVAGAEVRDVDAFVIQNGLPTSLLGMTYLGRLSQFEATPNALILRP